MNYRHTFHAGNAGDVLKHVVLVALLRALSRKDAPWCYLDTHAGAGGYDLTGASARRTGEWRTGIGTLWGLADPPAGALADYLALVRGAQPGPGLGFYPGSPMLAQALARPHDRLVLCEWVTDPCDALRRRFRHDRRVAVHRRDGYEAAGALLPPRERRGLTLIDPPYEAAQEARRAAAAVGTALRRFAGGVVALWYPMVHAPETAALRRLVGAAAGQALLLDVWLQLRDPAAGPGLAGAGMLVANPPHGVDAVLHTALAALAARLPGEDVYWDVVPLSPQHLRAQRSGPARGVPATRRKAHRR